MTRLIMLVEGQSEEIFVNRTLKPYLAERGVYVEGPIVLWTKRMPSGGGFRGGVSSWKKIQDSLIPLTADSNAWVTTLLDFYGLPEDTPGYTEVNKLGDPRHQVKKLESEIFDAIGKRRFIPFLALHEFEAWVFCAPKTIVEHFDDPSLLKKILLATIQAGEPELINHGATTHPKARLKTMVKGYKETSDSPTILGKIGIPAISASCPHFSEWLSKLEALAAVKSA